MQPFDKASDHMKKSTAIQMAIMDIIESGTTDKAELIAARSKPEFDAAVALYLKMMQE